MAGPESDEAAFTEMMIQGAATCDELVSDMSRFGAEFDAEGYVDSSDIAQKVGQDYALRGENLIAAVNLCREHILRKREGGAGGSIK